MGNCVGGATVPDNVFKVININDNKNIVQKGLMEVTATELIYVDSRSKEDWHWPLKYLRKYGSDGDVFTFEAGRKCPGGEGLYAFETKKASILFDMVARNINQGDMSPMPDPQTTDSGIMNFPPRRTSTTSPGPRDQPSYTNLDIMGNPLENGDHTPLPDEAVTPPDPTKFVYREVVFDRPPEEHPMPNAVPQKTPSYSKIDFDKTAQFNDQRMRGAGGPLAPVATTSTHGRTNSSSTGGSSPTKRERVRRTRVHTYGGRDRQVSRSESSFSSQSSLTESSRDVCSPGKPPNGTTPLSDHASSMYQNVQVGVEQQYQNVQLGTGDVSQVFEPPSPLPPQQQPNYCNVSITASGSSAVPSPMDTGAGHGHIIRENGDSMTTYAQLELSSDGHRSKRSMSSSGTRDSTHQQYTQLDFPVGEGSTPPRSGDRGVAHHGRRSASVSGTVPTTASGVGSNHVSLGLAQQNIPEEGIAQTTSPAQSKGEVKDETKVTYGVLNFTQMTALTELQRQREREVVEERQQREERERANTHGKKKGK